MLRDTRPHIVLANTDISADPCSDDSANDDLMRLYQQLAAGGLGEARNGGLGDAPAAGNQRGAAVARGSAFNAPSSFDETDLDMVCGPQETIQHIQHSMQM
jgi:hypothetical protein